MKLSRHSRGVITLLVVTGLVLVLAIGAPASSIAAGTVPVQQSTLDPTADSLATFQSHNQLIVSNKYGIFASYLDRSSNNLDQAVWRLARSEDNGATFQTIYQSDLTKASDPPALETDSKGNVYLAYSDSINSATNNNAHILLFRPANDFTAPTEMAFFTNGGAQKFSMILDEPNNRLYYAVHTLSGGDSIRLYTAFLGGTTSSTGTKLLTNGTHAVGSYPRFFLNTNGDLYLAWTTVNSPAFGNTGYWSIHFMVRKNGVWQKTNGTPLSLPIVADESGPTERITLDSEFCPITWLSGFYIKNGKAHFAYRVTPQGITTCTSYGYPPQASTAYEHYVRYDLQTQARDDIGSPTQEWGGATSKPFGLDGFFASSPTSSKLYYTSYTKANQLDTIVSQDNGATWQDYATSNAPVASYAVGGSRVFSTTGDIIGMYTDYTDSNHAVKFLKVNTEVSVPPAPMIRLNATISASNSAAGYPVANANDSNLSTLWLATLDAGAGSANNNATVTLDFSAPKYISTLKWRSAPWTPYPAQGPSDYVIETSTDGFNWQKVIDHKGGTVTENGGVTGELVGSKVIEKTARYIRIHTTKVNDGTGWALSFYELWAETPGN